MLPDLFIFCVTLYILVPFGHQCSTFLYYVTCWADLNSNKQFTNSLTVCLVNLQYSGKVQPHFCYISSRKVII